jgi:23S rRNA pseudouridine1911/1915/1917 synthase
LEINPLFEDNHLLALNKPNGLLTQSDPYGNDSLEEFARIYIKQKYNKKGKVFLHAIHRIDRPVSGIVLFAKTAKALSRMNEAFKNKKVQKNYLALVHGNTEFEKITLKNWIKKNSKLNKSFIVKENSKNAQEAILHAKKLAVKGNVSLLHIKLETGRHHQIRCQLAHIGHPIVGDSKYGSFISTGVAIYLHAFQVTFKHPINNEKVNLCVYPPENLTHWKSFLEDIQSNKILKNS